MNSDTIIDTSKVSRLGDPQPIDIDNPGAQYRILSVSEYKISVIEMLKEEIKQELKEELLDEILEHIRIHYYDR